MLSLLSQCCHYCIWLVIVPISSISHSTTSPFCAMKNNNNIYVASASYLLEFETTGMLLPLTKWEVF